MNPRRYEITDFECSIILPLLPNKPQRRAVCGRLQGSERHLLAVLHWFALGGHPRAPCTPLYRLVRQRDIGVWHAIIEAVSQAYEGDLQMIDPSLIRVHQLAANVKRGLRRKPPAPLLGTSLQPDAWGTRGAIRPLRFMLSSTPTAIRSHSSSWNESA
jgi:hypothetical protein